MDDSLPCNGYNLTSLIAKRRSFMRDQFAYNARCPDATSTQKEYDSSRE